MKIRSYLVLGLLVLFISVAFLSSCFDQKTTENEQDVTKEKPTEVSEAPTYHENLVDGEQISLDEMKGKVMLVDFWATWCGPCRMEVPGFIELYDKYKDKGATIVGISVDKNPSTVRNFIKQEGINYPVIMTTKELQSEYEKAINQPIRAIPTTIIVNKAGEIASVHVGARPKEVFDEEIKKLLAES